MSQEKFPVTNDEDPPQPDKYDTYETAASTVVEENGGAAKWLTKVGLRVDSSVVNRYRCVAAEVCEQSHLSATEKREALEEMHAECMYEMPWPRFAIGLFASLPVGVAVARRFGALAGYGTLAVGGLVGTHLDSRQQCVVCQPFKDALTRCEINLDDETHE
mmetsp:Transcript_21488/g.54157  ORF Transcript_21488/g.54157 Transcript_21488/m.54157 type:complete len:161 (+) Transcript_21488:143-625(+)